MNRRLSTAFAVIPLIGLTVQSAALVLDRHDELGRLQRSDRLRRRAMTFSAVKEAERTVADALRKEGTTAGEPNFGGGTSVSEGPLPNNAFRLTGETVALRDETWSVEGTIAVREKKSPGNTMERAWKTEMRWNAAESRWRVLSVDLDFDPFGNRQEKNLPS